LIPKAVYPRIGYSTLVKVLTYIEVFLAALALLFAIKGGWYPSLLSLADARLSAVALIGFQGLRL